MYTVKNNKIKILKVVYKDEGGSTCKYLWTKNFFIKSLNPVLVSFTLHIFNFTTEFFQKSGWLQSKLIQMIKGLLYIKCCG